MPPVIVMPTTVGSGLEPDEEGQAGAVELGVQLAGLDAGADPRRTTLEVDLDAAEGAGAQEQRVVEGVVRAVTRGLRGDLDAVVDRPADGGDHVVDVVDLEDGHRVLRDVDDPGHAWPAPSPRRPGWSAVR